MTSKFDVDALAEEIRAALRNMTVGMFRKQVEKALSQEEETKASPAVYEDALRLRQEAEGRAMAEVWRRVAQEIGASHGQ